MELEVSSAGNSIGTNSWPGGFQAKPRMWQRALTIASHVVYPAQAERWPYSRCFSLSPNQSQNTIFLFAPHSFYQKLNLLSVTYLILTLVLAHGSTDTLKTNIKIVSYNIIKMRISLFTLLSSIFLCATNTAMAGAPDKCSQSGPAGTVMTQQFTMYSATVTIYQKTTTTKSNPPTRRLRDRRQVLEGQPGPLPVDPNDPSLQGTSAPPNGNDTTGVNNSTGSSNSTGGSNSTDSNNGTGFNNSTGGSNSTDSDNGTGFNNSTGGNNSTGLNTTQPVTNFTTIDMTPAEPTSWDCYAGSFQQPSSADCDVVIAAQLYNSTGSLTAFPGTYVFVSYGTCVTVFQNPELSEYSLQYNWAELGKTAQRIKSGCLAPGLNNIGGAALFDNYLEFSFQDVLISLQRYDSQPAPAPNVTSPNATSPDATSPNATSPDATSPNATSPNATSPNATSPNATFPDAAAPNETSPDTTSPNATSLEQ